MDGDTLYILFVIGLIITFGGLQALFNIIGVSLMLAGFVVQMAIKFFPWGDAIVTIGLAGVGFFVNGYRSKRARF